MLNVIIANIIGFTVVYTAWCFIERKIVKPKPISEWNEDQRLMLIFAYVVFSLVGLATLTC